MGNWTEVVRPRASIEGLKPWVELQFRAPKEVEAIVGRTLTWACGDVAKARKLLRLGELSLFGRTWGSRLVVANKPVESLIDTSAVINEIDLVARMRNGELSSWLAAVSVEGVGLWPFDTPLYLAMAEDLGGTAVFESVRAQVENLGLTIPEEMIRKARQDYRQMAGLSYWETHEDQILTSFSLCYCLWKMNTEKKIEVWELAEEGDVEEEDGVGSDQILTIARERLRMLARVILGRSIVTRDWGIGFGWGSVTYSDVLELLD